MTNFKPTKISEIKRIWEEEGFTLKKSLSQNFLIDQNIVDKIVEAADIQPGDSVLEIGPGSGAITLAMLKKGACVYAVEIDTIASKILKKYLGEYENFHLITGDILKTDVTFLKGPCKIVSNLPYHITSPILGKISEHSDIFSLAILMVQKEMAERIMAKAPSNNRGAFTVFTTFYFTKKLLFLVKPGCFTPRPKVDSVIISLIPKKELPIKAPSMFFKFVKKAFSQKRKMISSTIKEGNIKECLVEIGCSEKARPEELSTAQLIDLYNLHSSSSKEEDYRYE